MRLYLRLFAYVSLTALLIVAGMTLAGPGAPPSGSVDTPPQLAQAGPPPNPFAGAKTSFQCELSPIAKRPKSCEGDYIP
jgi:hypothetical protein